MCGIVGYIGRQSAKQVLVEGLRKLEYRGYDSAGFALMASGGADFVVRRAVGPVQNLADAAVGVGETESQGIAHTRWATHGAPSEINAHPHRAGDLILVHNGIIENHAQIKDRLIASGVKFSSQTDTEVFAQLIESHRRRLAQAQKGGDAAARLDTVKQALFQAVAEVQGHFAVLFMVQGLDGYCFGAQNGAPLVAALTDDGFYLASDLQPLIAYTKKVSFLPTGIVFVARREEIAYYDLASRDEIGPQWETIDWSSDQVAKDGFEHFMLKEIFQQPGVVADTLSGCLAQTASEEFLWDKPQEHAAMWKDVKKVFLIACGTAHYSAMVAKYYFERLARVPVEIDLASEFRYRNPVFEAGTLVGVISQSGETADTLSALRLAKSAGVPTFSVCNVPGSTIARESKLNYATKAGPEIGVASTKAFTTQLTLLCALALDVSRHKGLFSAAAKAGVAALARLPHDMEKVLANSQAIMELGATLESKKTILFVGRGTMYPIALEGALKLKEITYRHAEGYAAGELKHGPIALVDPNLAAVVLAPSDELFPKTLSNLEEIRSRNGMIIGIGEEGNEAFRRVCDGYIGLPKVDALMTPMLYVLPLQLMAYGLAKKLGCNIDKPRNLAKSVTVE